MRLRRFVELPSNAAAFLSFVLSSVKHDRCFPSLCTITITPSLPSPRPPPPVHMQSYLKGEGPEHWKGSLYVFDGRMAIPGDLRDIEGEAPEPCCPV